MYQLARSWGVQPTEFWEMTIPEWFAELEMNRPNNYAGKLTHDAVDSLSEDIELTEEEWWRKYGSTSH